MGIYDREYYRKDGPSLLGSLAAQGQFTNALIGANALFFLVQLFTRGVDPDGRYTEPFTRWLDLDVDKVLHGQVWRLLTYAFLHDTGSFWHIVMNMLVLFIFGRQVEGVLGGREYLRFYLVAAALSGVAFALAKLLHLHHGVAIGASGAVTAVLVLAACYNPRQVIYIFFVLPVPIWLAVILFVAADAFNLVGHSSERVATAAHLGGAAFGYAYYRLGLRVGNWLPSLGSLKREAGPAAVGRPRLRLYSEEEEAVGLPRQPASPARVGPARPDDEQLEAQVDAILEKIPRVGMEGLTQHERDLLLRASEMMKRRRS